MLYTALEPTVTRTIATGVSAPLALAFDRFGNEYVADYAAGTVTGYEPGQTSPLRTIDGLGAPDALAFGDRGDLYIADFKENSVSVYAPLR